MSVYKSATQCPSCFEWGELHTVACPVGDPPEEPGLRDLWKRVLFYIPMTVLFCIAFAAGLFVAMFDPWSLPVLVNMGIMLVVLATLFAVIAAFEIKVIGR